MLIDDLRAWYESQGMALPIDYVKTETVIEEKKETYRNMRKLM